MRNRVADSASVSLLSSQTGLWRGGIAARSAFPAPAYRVEHLDPPNAISARSAAIEELAVSCRLIKLLKRPTSHGLLADFLDEGLLSRPRES